ncbi:MAG: glycoside hydrolase family 92 protein [bacterium]
MLAPNIYSDVDGRYRGHDMRIHMDTAVKMYTVFSLWDTFRALHPLFNLIERNRTGDMVRSMLSMYQHDGHLPVWELAACETWCMIGYHSVPVIVDAFKKGITNFDERLALEAMKATAESNLFGLNWYREKGYIPADKEGASVSKTLEYAYDDWCIAEMANMLGDEDTYRTYLQRAQHYKNLYDPETRFFRGKSNGCFVEPFDPNEVNFMLTEANTWQYNFFVPQDINTHIRMMGGDSAYEAKLDQLFTSSAGLSGRHQSDITGLIGEYAHGNEPSHHMAYLYNYIGKPSKTQELVHRIMNELYTNQPDGLSGNEDCGQMSAWYVLSALGFYPVTPGSDKYVLGTPGVGVATIRMENGHTFTVKASGLNADKYFVREVFYNGEPWTKSYITHDMILQGGELIFVMDEKPGPAYGVAFRDRPVQQIVDHPIIPVPFFKASSRTFEDQLTVELACIDPEASLVYNKGGGQTGFNPYEQPFHLSENATLFAKALRQGNESFTEQANFLKIPAGLSVDISNPYSPQYTAGGDKALVNTIRGGDQFTTGNWQGYWGDDLVATIDLGKETKIKSIGAGFLQDERFSLPIILIPGLPPA